MKRILYLLPLFMYLIYGCKQEAQDPTSFVITGSNWDYFNDFYFEIGVRDTTPAKYRTIAKAKIENGEFTIKGKIEFPEHAYWIVGTTTNLAKYDKGKFILESGSYSLRRTENDPYSSIRVEGGKYNTLLYNDVLERPTVAKAIQTFSELSGALTDEDTLGTTKYADYKRSFKEIRHVMKDHYNELRQNHEDPMVRLLAIYWINPEELQTAIEIEKQIADLRKKLGDIPEVYLILEHIKFMKNWIIKSGTVTKGKVAKDFTAKDISGIGVHFYSVLEKNKYTLLEFWASWCGPCRGDIPHIKRAYNDFAEKGFEVISYSLDHDRDKWIKASIDEDISWFNVSDLQAFKSLTVKDYGVFGVPTNYLIDKEGIIVGQNLRHQYLYQELEELLIKN